MVSHHKSHSNSFDNRIIQQRPSFVIIDAEDNNPKSPKNDEESKQQDPLLVNIQNNSSNLLSNV